MLGTTSGKIRPYTFVASNPYISFSRQGTVQSTSLISSMKRNKLSIDQLSYNDMTGHLPHGTMTMTWNSNLPPPSFTGHRKCCCPNLLSYYLANKRRLHVCSQGLEIPTLIGGNRKIKITHNCHYNKN